MKVIGVIPARYDSSRFPGKPIVDIAGKPMIWWVYQKCVQVPEFAAVYVATDDERIMEVCRDYKLNAIMTSKEHLTGTDRVGEVASKIFADVYVNIQGDEPLLEPSTIREAIIPFQNGNDVQVVNLMTKIKDSVELVNSTIPKVIVNADGIGVFLTRSVAPYPKGRLNFNYYKQVCVYGFNADALNFYCTYGRRKGKAYIESIEDIEILRFIENGWKVHYVKVDSGTIAVDTAKDLEKVRMILECRGADV